MKNIAERINQTGDGCRPRDLPNHPRPQHDGGDSDDPGKERQRLKAGENRARVEEAGFFVEPRHGADLADEDEDGDGTG